ncbi:MAG TPA: class I SAM-dependent methyltransferase [Methylomirabilota bacterium]|nr:class I SAM-dependent methyltransferase [Methylomirabilota bacterium]
MLAPLYEGIRDHYGVAEGTHRFLRCVECGSATLDPLPTPERLLALYSSDYTFKPAPEEPEGLRRLLQTIEWRCFYEPGYRRRVALIRRLTGLRHGLVLEAGCGSGLFLRHLRKEGYTVEGVETSAADVAYARQRLGLTVFEGSLESLRLQPGRYDAVILVYVLEHIPDPAATLARIRTLLKPGGWAVLGLPVMDSGQARWLGARWSAVTEAPRHVAIPSVAGARRLLESAGFDNIRWAPSPLGENAGHIALSLLPAAATPRAYAGTAGGHMVARRAAGALLMLPSLVLAAVERLPGGSAATAGTMFFCGRRPGDSHVP